MITLIRPYAGFPAGAVVEFSKELEASLVGQGLASTSSGPVTPGAQTQQVPINPALPCLAGTAAIAAGSSSVVITNPALNANCKAFAQISQATADGTATSIVRAVCADGAGGAPGTLTIFANANATAATEVSYLVVAG